MARNPMQRRARTSFLLGMVITLLITGAIIAILFMQLTTMKKKEKEEQASLVNILVLNKNVESGAEITVNDFNEVKLPSANVPKNGITMENLGEKNIAKISMTSGTVVTTEMINIDKEKLADDVRRQEYNMIVLPIDLESGDYIDIRLMLPTGEDYIVLSKKIVEIPYLGEERADDTIYLELSEDELLTLSSAIVEAYWINGSKLYATKYVEAGMQQAAIPTYPPKKEVVNLINSDPNILSQAKTELASRYNTDQRNGSLNNAIQGVGEEGKNNVTTKMQESITNTKEDRKEYLQSMQ